ncbi:glycosyltransferase [Arthrobacter sp. Sa2CUA1]|uniref:D-inositol 3-phosphate glycosyltransferase n=1 Tax=Arthrobacter gallicola TaxID=2762225 RepID=A0ABR8UU32_9MICC|nr:glycosyltransferase [Arthrobacter gallicola]MBD7996069.1 glycosyltransferase [Arthrobacter gallicola]
MESRIKVLHVVESFGGGVATALAQYAKATPGVEHHLLRSVRVGDFADGGELAEFSSVDDLPRTPVAARKKIRQTFKQVQPEIVHAHSSFGGLFTRISVRATKKVQIVYTPHGYSFERRDISAFNRSLYRSVEAALSFNTSNYAACSPREAELSKKLSRRSVVSYVPNVLEEIPAHFLPDERDPAEHRVVSVGRLTAARDPMFFLKVVAAVKSVDPSIVFTWVGDGEESYKRQLIDAGVEVTGWLTRSKAWSVLRSSDTHIHTSAWDGFPMVLLEANQARVPSLVRDIDPFAGVHKNLRSETPEEMALKVLQLRSQDSRADVLGLWDDFLRDNTIAVQRARLMEIYEPIVLGAANSYSSRNK